VRNAFYPERSKRKLFGILMGFADDNKAGIGMTLQKLESSAPVA